MNEAIQAEEHPDPNIDQMVGMANASMMHSRARQEAAKANAVACSNTKLVACMDSLGFPSDCKPAENVNTGRVVREFMIQPQSIDPVFAHLRVDIARRYETGELEATEPMHPLCVAMRGQHNYDRLQDMQKQQLVMNLRSIKSKRMTIYKRGAQPDPVSNFSPERIERTNLMLVAALAGIGVPVLNFDGGDGSRRYFLPRFGYALMREDGTPYLEDAADPLFDLAPTPGDPWALGICSANPLHPVAITYNALRSRIRLRDLLNQKAPRLHIQESGMQAMISPNYTGRVMEQLTKRFGVPPL